MVLNERRADADAAPDRAYRWLKQAILDLPREEERLFTEGEVAESSGLSRTPVREALLRLETEGFIRRIPYKGAYVPAITDRDVRATMQARLLVEEWSVSDAGPWDDAFVARVTSIFEQQQALTDPVEFIAADLEFHTTIIQAAGNLVLSDFYRSLRDRQTRMGVKAVTQDSHRRERVLAEHRAIVDAIAARDADAAIVAVRTHLETTLSAMVDTSTLGRR